MAYSEQNAGAKIQALFQWLKNCSLQPRRDVRESYKLMNDVQVVEGIMRIFNNWSSHDEIYLVCLTFYHAYLSGDKRSKFFVTLFLPTMLQTYLIRHHTAKSALIAAAFGSGSKPLSSPSRQTFRRPSSPIFTLDDYPTPVSSPLESLAFLLFELCQLTPAFLRCPELYGEGSNALPDYRVPSIYHTPPFSASKSFEIANISSSSTLKCTETLLDATNGTQTAVLDIDPSCIVRVYVDAMIRQFIEGTEEQQAAVLISIRTYCDLVDRLTALNTQRVISCAHRHHWTLMIEFTIGIDKLLYMIAFEPTQLEEQRTDILEKTEELRDRMVEFLLPQIERYASYHCFVSVLLVVGAVRNAWRLRINSSSTANAIKMVPLHRRAHLTSDELVDASSATNSDETGGVSGEPSTTALTPHRPSIFTNANFRAEPVAEDIPITDANLPVEMRKRKLHLYHGHNRNVSVHNHIQHLHHFYHYQSHPDNFGDNEPIGSTDNYCNVLSSSALSLDQDPEPHHHHRRFWSRSRTEK